MRTKLIASLVTTAGVILFLNTFSCCSKIDSGEIGIQTLFGKPSGDLLSPGLNFINPFSSVHKIDLKIRSTNIDSEAASSDLQMVHTSVTLNYRVQSENVLKLFTTVSKDEEYIEKYIVNPAINESFKAVIAHFTAENLINKRDEVSKEVQKELSIKLNRTYLIVDSISITNFTFSKSFNDAIESKVTAQQQVLTAQNNFQRQKIENDIKVSKARAEAEALSLQKTAVTEELLKLREVENTAKAIEKWNGVLPTYTANVPFIKGL